MTARQIDDRVPIGDPERDVIEGQGLHAATIPSAFRLTSWSPVTDQRFRLVERELDVFLRDDAVVLRFAAVFFPPRDAAALDGARLSALAFLPPALAAFFLAAVFFPPRDAAAFDGARFAELVFLRAALVVFFRAELVVFLRAAPAAFFFAAVFFPPREAAAFDGARFAELVFLRAALVVFLRADVVVFLFAAAVFLRPAVDVFLRAAVELFFAAELFFRPAPADFLRALVPPVFEREDALAALVELDPEDAASPVSARCWLTVRAAISSARSGERPSSSSLSLMCSYCRSRLSLHASGISTPRVACGGSFPHIEVCNARSASR
jgi:hypothetical protein